jgi:hypothetical protein
MIPKMIDTIKTTLLLSAFFEFNNNNLFLFRFSQALRPGFFQHCPKRLKFISSPPGFG